MQVLVRDNNVDQALRALKKKMQREGIFREMKLRRNFEKPSERRAREKAEHAPDALEVAARRGLLRQRRDQFGGQRVSGEELVGSELRVALDALGKVVGAVYTDDILDRVFSRFCIGK